MLLDQVGGEPRHEEEKTIGGTKVHAEESPQVATAKQSSPGDVGRGRLIDWLPGLDVVELGFVDGRMLGRVVSVPTPKQDGLNEPD